MCATQRRWAINKFFEALVRGVWWGGREAEGAPLLREYAVKSCIRGSNPRRVTRKTAHISVPFFWYNGSVILELSGSQLCRWLGRLKIPLILPALSRKCIWKSARCNLNFPPCFLIWCTDVRQWTPFLRKMKPKRAIIRPILCKMRVYWKNIWRKCVLKTNAVRHTMTV